LHALLAEVLQQQGRDLADHAAVHAQGAEGLIELLGVVDVAQRRGGFGAEGRAGRFAEQAAEAIQLLQAVAAFQLVQTGNGLIQLAVFSARQLIFREAKQRARAAQRLLRAELEAAQGLQQLQALRVTQQVRGLPARIGAAGGRDHIGCVAQAKRQGRKRGHRQGAEQQQAVGSFHRLNLNRIKSPPDWRAGAPAVGLLRLGGCSHSGAIITRALYAGQRTDRASP